VFPTQKFECRRYSEVEAEELGPLYTRSQDHESPGPNNSILNLLFDLKKYFNNVHLGPKQCFFDDRVR
jgi:hypothetical protein